MRKKSTKNVKKISEVETVVVCSNNKFIKLKVCKLLQPMGFLEIFTPKEEALNSKHIADFCIQYDKFFAYAKNAFYFLAENQGGISVLELFEDCSKLKSEAYDLNFNKILSVGTQVVLVA